MTHGSGQKEDTFPENHGPQGGASQDERTYAAPHGSTQDVQARTIPTLVTTGHEGERCARPEARRVHAIEASLKRSAEHSKRRKTGAYRSALSMLTFYINRDGKTLPKTQRTRPERAKVELKREFGRE